MTFRIETPASMSAMGQARNDRGMPLAAGRALRGRILSQFVNSCATAAVYDGEALVMLMGIYPYPEFYELWFVAGPHITAKKFKSVRVFKSVLAALSASYENVVSFVRTDTPDAARLARIGGALASGETGHLGHIPFEVYKWADC